MVLEGFPDEGCIKGQNKLFSAAIIITHMQIVANCWPQYQLKAPA